MIKFHFSHDQYLLQLFYYYLILKFTSRFIWISWSSGSVHFNSSRFWINFSYFWKFKNNLCLSLLKVTAYAPDTLHT